MDNSLYIITPEQRISSFLASLKACVKKKDVYKAFKVHADILTVGLLEDVPVGNMVVIMYAKCGAVSKAQQVLEELPIWNVVSWNALITGYVEQGQGKEALACYGCMRSKGFSPDAITYTCVLKACGLTQELDTGKQIHEEIASQSLLKKDVVLSTALISMYAKCGAVAKAQLLLEELPVRNGVSWNALILGYIQQGLGLEALDCYEQMQSEGLSPDAITYSCILKACSITKEADRGKKIHDEIVSLGLLETDLVLGNVLIDMYSKCGVLAKAQQVLYELPVRDVVSWNGVIGGYAQQGWGRKALDCYKLMQNEGLSPNAITYTCILSACGIAREPEKGKEIHDEIVSRGLLLDNIVLGNALIDMYVKCGALNRARAVLNQLPLRNVISWSALIAGFSEQGQCNEALDCFRRMQGDGVTANVASWNALTGSYAQQGLADEALDCFCQMQDEGTPPNAMTFSLVLNACNHSGLVDEGVLFFESMNAFEIEPDNDHHICMVDLFGRAAHFHRAMAVIKRMPSSDEPPVWSTLLGACQKGGNVKLGRFAFEYVVQLDESDPAPYILMANIYAAAGMTEDAQKIQAMRVERAYAR